METQLLFNSVYTDLWYCCLTKERRASMSIRYAAERDKAGVIRQLTTLTVD